MIDFSVYMMNPTYSNDETPKAYAKNQVSEPQRRFFARYGERRHIGHV